MRPRLFELFDDLHFVAGNVALVEKVNVLDAAIVEYEIVDVIVMDLAGLVDDPVAWAVQIGDNETRPFRI